MNKNPFAIALTVVVLALAVWTLVAKPQVDQIESNDSQLAAVASVATQSGLSPDMARSLVDSAQAGPTLTKPTSAGWIKLGNFSYYSSAKRPAINYYQEPDKRVVAVYSPVKAVPGSELIPAMSVGYEVSDPYLEKLLARSGKAPLDYYVQLMKKWGWDPKVVYVNKNTPVLTQTFSNIDELGKYSQTYVFWLTVSSQGKPAYSMYSLWQRASGAATELSPEEILKQETGSNGLVSIYLSKYPSRLK